MTNDQISEKLTKDDHINEWEKCIETSRHFNDVLWKIRLLGLSVVVTILTASITILVQDDKASPLAFKFIGLHHPSVFIASLAQAFLAVLFLFDFFYYYKGLTSSVKRTEAIEKKYDNELAHAKSISEGIPLITANIVVISLYLIFAIFIFGFVWAIDTGYLFITVVTSILSAFIFGFMIIREIFLCKIFPDRRKNRKEKRKEKKTKRMNRRTN